MGELSQAEIDALLGGSLEEPEFIDEDISLDEIADISEYVSEGEASEGEEAAASPAETLSEESMDVLGEIGKISMGTAATTLFALLRQKVWITTPVVSISDWQTLSDCYDRPCVGVLVDYKEGLEGTNVLILKDRDVKIIADLMMGGDGAIDEGTPVSDLDMSAIGEAMNQMVGSSSTSISSMIRKKIDIATPKPFLMDFADTDTSKTVGFKPEDMLVKVAFKMEIGTLINSEIMQILPIDFAIRMVAQLKNDMLGEQAPEQVNVDAAALAQPAAGGQQPQQMAPQAGAETYRQEMPMDTQAATVAQGIAPGAAPVQPVYAYPPQMQPPPGPYPQGGYPPPQQEGPPVNVQPVQFQSFDGGHYLQNKENIGIIMDVPLDITVELGRTRKKIHEILEFSPGTIIDLDKLAGEPIDILVNGKFVAKGEVVVIDENFGIRITDIISADKRI